MKFRQILGQGFERSLGQDLGRVWQIGWAVLVAVVVFLGSGDVAIARGEYAPPLSFSNAELSNRDFSGQWLRGSELSNANLTGANFSDAHIEGAAMSGSTLTDTDLSGAFLTNTLMDSIKFERTDLTNAVLVEALLLGSTFNNVVIDGADFTDALLDGYQVKQLCAIAKGRNPSTDVDTRESLGCRD